MKKRGVFVAVVLFFLAAFPLFSQETRDEVFIVPVLEGSLYSLTSAAVGGGLMLGYGERGVVGVKAVYFRGGDGLETLEATVFFRLYFPYLFHRNFQPGGLFLQLNAGATMFAGEDFHGHPAWFTVGLSAGWRFLIGKRWFVEPSVRTGYPFITGAGIGAGFRM